MIDDLHSVPIEIMGQYKEKMDNKTIDILKHDMIANTGYVNMLTFMFLIATIFCICYFYKPEFVKLVVKNVFKRSSSGFLAIFIEF